jgi:hypothetical protein
MKDTNIKTGELSKQNWKVFVVLEIIYNALRQYFNISDIIHVILRKKLKATLLLTLFYWLNTHAPLQRSNTTCFIVRLCYYFDIGDAVTRSVSGFPLQLPLLHRYVLVPLKVTSAIVTIGQSLSNLRTTYVSAFLCLFLHRVALFSRLQRRVT